MNMKKWILPKPSRLIAIGLLLGLSTLCLVACNNSSDSQGIATQTPSTNPVHQPVTGNVTANGVLVPARQVALSFGVGGDIEAIDVELGENVHYLVPKSGDKLYMFLADGQTSVVDGPLESDGAGALQVHTPQAVDEGGTATYTINVDAVVGYAEEVVTASGARARIRVRIA